MGGLKVLPLLIEDQLLEVPGVTGAAAFGIPDVGELERIRAAVVASRRIPEAELNAVCTQKLVGMAPAVVAEPARLARNEVGRSCARD
jgi:acyl-CoA synthetase (AMP-forming)/AMP-acid ligase II